jgi:hypothetical protein
VSHDASLFSVELPPNGCQEHRAVSTVVAELGCELATNGGFFQFTPPACQFNLIADNDVKLWTTDLNFVALGISQARKRTTVGYIGDASGYEFQSLVSGQGWLVRDGKTYVNSSREFSPKNGFYSEKVRLTQGREPGPAGVTVPQAVGVCEDWTPAPLQANRIGLQPPLSLAPVSACRRRARAWACALTAR